MATVRGERISWMLGIVAAAALLTALLTRPRPWSGDAARFAQRDGQILVGALPGRTYALDVVIVDGRQLPITAAPLPIPAGSTIAFSGWLIDWRTRAPEAAIRTSIDGAAPRAVADPRVARPDVAAHLHDPAAARSGFLARLALAGLAPGPHRIRVSVVDADGHTGMLPTSIAIVIEPRATHDGTGHRERAAGPP